MSKEIRIVIADDHPIFRSGLRMVIETDPLLQVMAEADDGESALAHIIEFQPNVVVLDINMPPPDGLAIARELHSRRSAVRTIVMTMHKDEALLNAALDAGVKGFVVKDAAADEIIGCIRALAAGQSYLSPTLSNHLLNRRSRAAQGSALENLTTSEQRILQHIAESKSNKEIAAELFISIRTVEHHRSNICAKLGLTGKNALLTFALTHKSDL
jgi:DNA-binding NarL/FixJ family response regulator